MKSRSIVTKVSNKVVSIYWDLPSNRSVTNNHVQDRLQFVRVIDSWFQSATRQQNQIMQVLHDVWLVIVFKYIFDIEGTKVCTNDLLIIQCLFLLCRDILYVWKHQGRWVPQSGTCISYLITYCIISVMSFKWYRCMYATYKPYHTFHIILENL